MFHKPLCAWLTEAKKLDAGEITQEEYDKWRYIVDLNERVITVSMKSLDIIEALPPLNEQPQPENWPEAWKVELGDANETME